MTWFDLGADLFPLLAGVLAAVSCGVLGNFLVLRRMSLMGDAISHSVLPGLVLAFLITSTRSPVVMLIGATAAGVLTVVLVELVKRLGRVESGAAMGVVFSVLFALGVLLIERAARQVDLDADCVLHGQLETLAWYTPPRSWAEAMDVRTWLGVSTDGVPREGVPKEVWTLLAACVGSIGFVTVLFKELRIAAFDPALATTQGFSAGFLHYALMVVVAAATVASFEAVGSILVIAMLVCPAATARLLTDRLRTQIVLSIAIAAATGVLGYFASRWVPALFGKAEVSAAGTMAVTAGVLLVVAVLASPSHGVAGRLLRRRAVASVVARDDVLAALYRARESPGGGPAREPEAALSRRALRLRLGASHASRGVAACRRAGLVSGTGPEGPRLTEAGVVESERVVRRHRLWERYLVDEAGLAADHVHAQAEVLEHLPVMPDAIADTDPHGKPIPRVGEGGPVSPGGGSGV